MGDIENAQRLIRHYRRRGDMTSMARWSRVHEELVADADKNPEVGNEAGWDHAVRLVSRFVSLLERDAHFNLGALNATARNRMKITNGQTAARSLRAGTSRE